MRTYPRCYCCCPARSDITVTVEGMQVCDLTVLDNFEFTQPEYVQFPPTVTTNLVESFILSFAEDTEPNTFLYVVFSLPAETVTSATLSNMHARVAIALLALTTTSSL